MSLRILLKRATPFERAAFVMMTRDRMRVDEVARAIGCPQRKVARAIAEMCVDLAQMERK